MQPAASYHRRHRPDEFIEILAKLDLAPANDRQCDLGREIAAALIHPGVAAAATLRRIQRRSGSAIFVQVQDGELTGVSGALPLTPAGLQAIVGHTFNARDPEDRFLCAPGDPLAAVYAWAFAATTRRASAAVVRMMVDLREHYADLPFFTRAVTAAGAKVVRGRMGYSPFPGAPDDLLWNPVNNHVEERAA